MSTAKPRHLLAIEYEEAAEAYLRSLPPEHFMEAYAQGTQRKITLGSFEVVRVRRPDVQLFNEMLVQYPHPPRPRRGQPAKIHQVVPDNVAVVHGEPIKLSGSFNLPLQPVRPFWVMEYVSKYNKRKDYEDNFTKYEVELKVPYYLLFYPDNQELTLYRHTGKKYKAVPPNGNGRHPVPELEMEVGLLEGWARFWYRGVLIPLPGDLQRELDQVRRQLEEEKRRADAAHQAQLRLEQQLEALQAQLQQAQEHRKS